MKRILLALLFVLAAAVPAHASCGGCTVLLLENWDNYGTVAYNTGTGNVVFGNLYDFHPLGNVSNGTITVTALTDPPWNPRPVTDPLHSTYVGHFVRVAAGGCTAGHHCTGIYINLGNTHKAMLVTFFFRTPTTSTYSGTNYFFRWNRNDNVYNGGTLVGTDFATLALLDGVNNGIIEGPGLFNSSSGIADTNWHIFDACVDQGTGAADGTYYLSLDGTNVTSATGLSWGATNRSINDITLDNEDFTGTAVTVDFGPIMVGDPGSCSSSTTFSSGGHLYVANYLPTSDNSVTFSRSAGSANYTQVNSSPAGANYNYSSTVTQNDLYNVTSLGTVTPLAIGELMSVERNGGGDRLALPQLTISGVTTKGTVGPAWLINSGVYNLMFSAFSGSAIPTADGIYLQN